ncbi:MAG TPA: hypothetical protein VJT77_12535 [Burkholderiales bacterium]|nr:hypothetical protein [Burkholderiales bacterium]
MLLAAVSAFAQERLLQLPNGEELRYRVITEGAESARPVALQILKHLAAGDLDAAAAMSNAPERRLEVLRDFRNTVGEEEFKRLFGRYFAPRNRILMEAALGKRRLLIWDLGEVGNQLAGQYFVELEGKFVMDDVPNDERTKLQRLLESQRKEKNSGSGS